MGGVAVIQVGAPTEVEMKEKKDRVEDALHATRAAVAEGVVPGGGVALLSSIQAVEKLLPSLDGDQRLGAQVVSSALSAPLRQIAYNAGKDGSVVVHKVLEMHKTNPNSGYNAKDDCYGDMFEMGVLDPTKVVRCAMTAASSVALLLTTEAIIAADPSEESSAGGASPMAGMPGGMGGMGY